MGLPSKPCAKRALLIGSSYKGLPGTENDVETMSAILKSYDFDVDNETYVKRLCGKNATRKNILDCWKDIIDNSSNDDVVVIYYSGHGGLAKPEELNASTQDPKRIQLLVPTDFDLDAEEFLGIMDDEISLLLLRTTYKTPNVTYIVDCCHSAHLGRGPRSKEVWAKQSGFNYTTMLNHRKRLQEQHKLVDKDEFWNNTDVVRIAASAELESAWQYKNKDGKDVGILTEKLSHMMQQAGKQMSWRNIMLGVKELVDREFDGDREQQARSAGPDSRIPFAMERRPSKAFLAVVGKEHTQIKAGSVHRVHEDDVYTLIPFAAHDEINRAESYPSMKATIGMLNGFTSIAFDVPEADPPFEALALPYSRQNCWPAKVPDGLPHVQTLLDKSHFFKRCGADEKPIVELVRKGDGRIALYGGGIQLGLSQVNDAVTTEKLFSVAHMFAEAQDILSLEGGKKNEKFMPDIDIEIGVTLGKIDKYKQEQRLLYNTRTVDKPGALNFTVGEKYYVEFDLQSDDTVFINAFRVSANGKTTLFSRNWEFGIDVYETHRTETLMHTKLPPQGLLLDWPGSVPTEGCIEENFLLVLTKKGVDLRSLETLSPEDYLVARGPSGDPSVASKNDAIPYAVIRIPYTLKWDASVLVPSQKPIAGPDLPVPEATEEGKKIATYITTTEEAVARGHFGALYRTIKRVPKMVSVVNMHDEEILVAVSQYSPTYRSHFSGVTAGPAGGGLNFSTSEFRSEATKKTMPPCSVRTFPIETRYDGFGVISIYKGSEPNLELVIENDHVPLGATIYFQGQSQLQIIEG